MLGTHQLNVFLTASGTLNFTTAARRLHMTQPSVSQHIRSLEQTLGVTLFYRSGPRLSLTDAGETLVPLAQHMVDASLRIEETMQSLQGIVHGHLKIGCSSTLGKYCLPVPVAKFMSEHPQITASCQLMTSEEAVQALLDNRIHLALTNPGERAQETLSFRPFITDEVSLIVPAGHAWLEADVITPAMLQECEFILREDGSHSYRAVEQGLRGIGLSLAQLRSHLMLWNSEAIALAVQEGIGAAFVPAILLERLQLDGVKTVRCQGLHIEQTIYLGQNIVSPASIAQSALWHYLFSTAPAGDPVATDASVA